VFEGTATLSYRQPAWLADPFTGEPAGEQAQGTTVLGGHYQVTGGLHLAASGNVYQAVDTRDGNAVVIKQARALVAESDDQVDTRMRLRNERRALAALAGVTGVPRLLDHFRHGDDEFLVTSDCGEVSLVEDVFRHGPYLVGGTSPARRLDDLAVALARILADVHARGVIMRDLAPKNIVIGDTGPVVLDFGLARYDGLHLSGATPGFAPARQWRGEPPAEADDYHALGMTLLFAATGMLPVILGDDRDQPPARASLPLTTRAFTAAVRESGSPSWRTRTCRGPPRPWRTWAPSAWLRPSGSSCRTGCSWARPVSASSYTR
jgi:serine/threonine protein kinase